MHNVGTYDRCHDDRWSRMIQAAVVCKHEGTGQAGDRSSTGPESSSFVPERFEKIYYNWLENIRDWCISRQLWWGHRIPAYYCAVTAAR